MLGERRAERYAGTMLELRPDLLALLRVEICIEGDILYSVLQVILGVEFLLRREVPVEHDVSLLLLTEQPAPEGTPGRFGAIPGLTRQRAEWSEIVFGAYGVAAPDYHRVRGPGIAGFGPDLLFYSGQP